MSDYIIKIIPENALFCMSTEEAAKTTRWLKQKIAASQIVCRVTDAPQFVDCGSNLERIICPKCGADISLDWWSESMDALYVNGAFRTLMVKTPCCQRDISLNDLDYHFLCGYSCIEYDIHNPIVNVDDSLIQELEDQFGIKTRIIRCHN